MDNSSNIIVNINQPTVGQEDSSNIIVNINQSTVGILCVGPNPTLSTGNVYINSNPQETTRKHQNFHLSKTVKSFQGRSDELKQLSSWLFKDNKKMAVICGLPGYGKTELARRFAHYCKEENKVRSVLWLNADTHADLEKSLRDLLRWLGDRDKADLDVQSVVEAVQQHFSSDSHLFVLDNALNIRSVLGFEPEGECRCVFTSHMEDWGDDVPALKLMPLSLDSAVDVLRAELNQRFQDKDLEQYKHLVQLLSCVPLALQVAAAYVRQEIDDPGQLFHLCDYVEQLQDPSPNFIARPLPDSSSNKYDKTFLQAIQISLNKIKNNRNYDSELANDILHICAYLNPEQIYYFTLLEIPCLKKVLDIYRNPNKHIRKTCALLRRYSFISDVNKKISIHRLIQLSVIHINSEMSVNKSYFACLELLLNFSENSEYHSPFILKYAEYRSNIFDEFYTEYKLQILNNEYFFWHIILSNCKIILIKILDDLGDGATEIINARCMLHRAVWYKKHRILELLLQKYEINVDELNKSKYTALRVAAFMFELYSMKILVVHKADVNAVVENEDSVLHEVIRASGEVRNFGRSSDAIVAVQRLVELGARTDAVGHRNRSLVHVASLALSPDLVRCLVKNYGCDVNAVDMDKRTPLHYVAMSSILDKGKQQGTVKCLLELGARRDVKNLWGQTPAEDTRDTSGQSDLADYIENPSTEIQENEPVVNELRGAVASGDLTILNKVLEQLGERALQVSNESCLLYEAVEHRKQDVLEMLVDRGVDVDCRTITKCTPLHHAAWKLDMPAIQYLVEHGADVDAIDALGRSVLHGLVYGAGRACNPGCGGEACKALRWLVERGAQTDVVTPQGASLLHAASFALSTELVRCLVNEYSLDINAVDEVGWTPLFWITPGIHHWLAEESRGLSMATCLLELGAHANAINAQGKMAADVALVLEYNQLATLLTIAAFFQIWKTVAPALLTGCIFLFILFFSYLYYYACFEDNIT